jgi:MFS family permease
MTDNKLWTQDFILLFCANFLMAIAFYLLIPTLPFYLISTWHLDKGMAGLVLASYVIASIATRPFSGYFVDRFSRKNLYIISYAMFVIIFGGYVIAGSLILFIIFRILHGVIWGMLTTASNTLVIDITPSSRRGEAIGIFGLSSNIAMTIGPLTGLLLYERLPFDYIFYTAALTGLAGVLTALPMKVRERPKFVREPLSLDRFVLLKGIPSGINLILITVSYGMIFSFSAMYGKEINISNPGAYFIIMAIGIMFSRMTGGKLVDKGRLKDVVVIAMIVLTGGMLILSLSSNQIAFFSSALVAGVGFGLLFPALQTLMVNLSSHRQRGTAISTYFTAFDLGVGSGMFLGGKIGEMIGLSGSFMMGSILTFISVFYFLAFTNRHYNRNRTDQSSGS